MSRINILNRSIFLKPATILIASCALLLPSCEKVIDIDLNESEKQYVVEGNVSSEAMETAEVRISKTRRFSEKNSFDGISGASVNIQVNNGVPYALTETEKGVYKTDAFKGTPGASYKLTVQIDGQTFSGQSTMPAQVVTIDNLEVDDFGFGGNTVKIIRPTFRDPAGVRNYYRFIQYNNGKLVEQLFSLNDELSDGATISRGLVDADSELKAGDSVTVVMQCIDAAVYKYWFSMEQSATGQNQNATPANPVSNLTGGALGYFSAHSVSKKSIRVP